MRKTIKQIILLIIIVVSFMLTGMECITPTPPSNTIDSTQAQFIINEAREYVDAPYEWYFRNNESDTESEKVEKGIIYSFGSKDDIDLFAKKLEVQPLNAIKWSMYKYKTGRFDTEYKTDQGLYWMGIDCSGLIQRCASLYTSLEGLNNEYERKDNNGNVISPYYVTGNAISTSGLSSYGKKQCSGNKKSENLDKVAIGDLVLWTGHAAIVSVKNGDKASEIKVINALGWEDQKTTETERKVWEMPLNYRGLPTEDFVVYRFYKKQTIY